VLFLCLSCYALFKYKQNQIRKEVRAKRREEIFAYEAAEAARILQEAAELMDEAKRAAARRAERRKIREMTLLRSPGAHAVTSASTSVPPTEPLPAVGTSVAPAQRTISQASSDSSFHMSSLHSSEMSGYDSYEIDVLARSADEFSDVSPVWSMEESVESGLGTGDDWSDDWSGNSHNIF